MSISETLLLFQLITTIVFGILGYIKNNRPVTGAAFPQTLNYGERPPVTSRPPFVLKIIAQSPGFVKRQGRDSVVYAS